MRFPDRRLNVRKLYSSNTSIWVEHIPVVDII